MFTPDGGHLIATYDTGRAYLWDIRPVVTRHACPVAGRRSRAPSGRVPARARLRPRLLNGRQRPEPARRQRGQRLEH